MNKRSHGGHWITLAHQQEQSPPPAAFVFTHLRQCLATYQHHCQRTHTQDPHLQSYTQIDLDIPRTFPTHAFFSQPTSLGQQELQRVLSAYVAWEIAAFDRPPAEITTAAAAAPPLSNQHHVTFQEQRLGLILADATNRNNTPVVRVVAFAQTPEHAPLDPAEASGAIRVGDAITHVNGTSMAGCVCAYVLNTIIEAPRPITLRVQRGPVQICTHQPATTLPPAALSTDNRCGYVQGMNMIAGHLLKHVDENYAFHLLAHLMVNPKYNLQCILRKGMGGLHVKLHVVQRLVEKYLPLTSHSLAAANVPLLFFCTEWVLTLFSYVFEGDFLNTFFDLFFEHGWRAFYQVTLSLLESVEQDLVAAANGEDVDDIQGNVLSIVKGIGRRAVRYTEKEGGGGGEGGDGFASVFERAAAHFDIKGEEIDAIEKEFVDCL